MKNNKPASPSGLLQSYELRLLRWLINTGESVALINFG
jgi:hypothetical protein